MRKGIRLQSKAIRRQKPLNSQVLPRILLKKELHIKKIATCMNAKGQRLLCSSSPGHWPPGNPVRNSYVVAVVFSFVLQPAKECMNLFKIVTTYSYLAHHIFNYVEP